MYRWMFGVKRIYDINIFKWGNMCNKISMDFNLQQEWDWLNDGTNEGHIITWWCMSQQPVEEEIRQGSSKECYM